MAMRDAYISNLEKSSPLIAEIFQILIAQIDDLVMEIDTLHKEVAKLKTIIKQGKLK